MAGRRRRSRIFVDVDRPAEDPAEPAVDTHTPAADDPAPAFVITPVPQTTTQPMRVIPPPPRRPRKSKGKGT